jgi:thiamine-phosphate pyrophosphorylase
LWLNSDFEMKLVVISPEQDDPREIAVLGALFAAGLERYHVRKPHWSAAQLETWLSALPAEWRPRLVLHSHHELVAMFGLGGYHWRDEKGGAACPQDAVSALRSTRSTFTSRSCHDFTTLRASLGHYDSMFFGPVFPSISKPGYMTELTAQVERGVPGLHSFSEGGPTRSFENEDLNASGRRIPPTELSSLLNSRTANERRTTVLALGGVTAERLPQARALGFDGVAVLGAVWQAADPVAAFCEIQSAVFSDVSGRAKPPGEPRLASARRGRLALPYPNHAA